MVRRRAHFLIPSGLTAVLRAASRARVSINGAYTTQYLVTFTQSGLDGTATGTVVTVDGAPQSSLPYTKWVNSGANVSFAYSDPVASSTTGKRFDLTGTSQSSPYTVSAPVSINGAYTTQYLVTFTQSGLDGTATGTVVTVDGAPQSS